MQRMNLRKRPIVASNDLFELHNRPSGSVSEKDIKEKLRRYNLRDGLITLGKASSYFFKVNEENKIGPGAYTEQQTGLQVTQFALAYLANILLISGSNDYKSRYIREKDNWLILCQIYNNLLVVPTLNDMGEVSDRNKFLSIIIRLNYEQMTYQFSHNIMIARTYLLFNDLAEKIHPRKFEKLTIIFEKETGLTLHDYFWIAFCVFTGSVNTATISALIKSNIPQLKDVLIKEKVIRFFNILKTDYETFRKEDIKLNKNLKTVFTRNRFNPLLIYPIIETKEKKLGDPFVIPNIFAYFRKAFGELYWWFHRHFEKENKHLEFREYFGEIFQEYVGLILKCIYGEESVNPEVKYGRDKKRFIDWWVKRKNKIYLFEAKAIQFTLESKQTGDIKLIEKREIKKVIEAIVQVYSRILDIQKYRELIKFKYEKLIPVIVVMDVPFICNNVYEELIEKGLDKVEKKDSRLKGIKKFEIFIMNIEELELFDEAIDKIELEDIFPVLEKDISKGFLSVVRDAKGPELRNRLLDKTYKDFFKKLGHSKGDNINK